MSETSDVLARFSRHIRQASRRIDRLYTTDSGDHALDLEDIMQEARVCVCIVTGIIQGPDNLYGISQLWTVRETSAHMMQTLNYYLRDWARATVSAEQRQRLNAVALEWPSGEVREVPFSDARLAEVDVADIWRKYPTLAGIIRDGYTEQELADAEGHTHQAIHKRYAKELEQARAEWPEGMAG